MFHVKRALTAFVLAPVRLYGRISPAFPARCKYEPTCSAYAVDAVERYGVLRGAVLAAWRVARCNPWSRGGLDPVEAQTLFSGPRPRPEPPAAGTGRPAR